MITVEDIESVIHRIRFGGDGLDTLLLAVKYLTAAKGWKKKAEFADLVMESFNEELLPEKAIEFFKCRTSLNKRYAWLGEATARAEKLEAVEKWERELTYLEITEERRNELKEILGVER